MFWQSRSLARVMWVVGAVALGIGEASAQPQAENPGISRIRAALGDTLRVETGDGAVHKGVLTDLQPTSLAILANGTREEFAGSDIRRITRENPDSLANGARNGAIVGGALLGTLALLAAAEGFNPDPAKVAAAMVVYAGIGAAIGAGIDAAIRDHTLIYMAPAAPRTRVSVTPLVSPRAAGVAVRVVW